MSKCHRELSTRHEVEALPVDIAAKVGKATIGVLDCVHIDCPTDHVVIDAPLGK